MFKIFKSKGIYVAIIFSAVIAVTMNIVTLRGESALLSETALSMGLMILPMIMCVTAGVYISSDFTGGIVRNKVIVGNKRRNIILSWSLCYVLCAVIIFAVFMGAAFISALFLLPDLSSLKPDIVAVDLAVALVMVISNVFLIIFVCTVVKDAKSIAVLYLVEQVTAIIPITATMSKENEIMTFLMRFYPQGQTMTLTLLEMPDKPWLTVLCSAALGIAFLVLTIVYFEKNDLK